MPPLPRRQNFLYCHQDSFQDFPNMPGRFIVKNFVNGKNSWRRSTPIKNKPKSLVIADWMLQDFHEGKLIQVIELMKALLKEGFPIYVWQKNKAVRLTEENIDFLIHKTHRGRINLKPSEVITQSVASEYRIPKKELLVVDNHVLETLLDEALPIERKRTLKISGLVNKSNITKRQIEKEYLDGPNPATLVNSQFGEMRMPEEVKEYSSYKITPRFEKLSITPEALIKLLEGTSYVVGEHTLTIEDLKQIKEISIFNTYSETITRLPFPNLVKLSEAAPQLQSLHIKGCWIDDTNDSKLSTSFNKLLSLNLVNIDLETPGFKKILESSPELRSLEIEAVKGYDQSIKEPLKEGSLKKLTKVDLISNKKGFDLNSILEIAPVTDLLIDMDDFFEIEDELFHIKHIKIFNMEEINSQFFDQLNAIIPKGNKLKRLSFDSTITNDDLNLDKKIDVEIEELQASKFVTDDGGTDSFEILFKIPQLKKIICEENEEVMDTYFKENYGHFWEDDNDDDMDDYAESKDTDQKVPEIETIDHEVNGYFDFKPTTEFKFKANQLNDSKDQYAIIQKLSQYFTLEEKNIGLIPEIQDGICAALSFLYREKHTEWKEIIGPIVKWDGSKEELDKDKKALDASFGIITDAILFQKNSPLISYFIGNNIPELLRHKKPHLIGNPWHSITIAPAPISLEDKEPAWEVYDSNSKKDPQIIKEKDLPQLIRKRLGNLITVNCVGNEKRPPVPMGILSNDQFIKDGGLLSLYQVCNYAEIFQTLLTLPSITLDGLSGLLLRDTKGTPAWARSLTNPALSQFTFQLLQFYSHYSNGIEILRESLENLAPEQQKTIAQTLSWMAFNQGTPNVFIQSLADVLLNNPKSEKIVKQFQTWKKNINTIESLPLFLNDITKKLESKKTILLELKSETSIQGMRFALQKHFVGRPVFYVNSPDDLICSARWIERDEKTNLGTPKDAPGGPLYEFLKQNKNKNPLLIVNYENFTPEDIVKFNALLDKVPSADGYPLPDNTEIIGLTNTNNPDAYKGADFYSRFGRTEECSVPEKTLQVPPLSFIDKDQEDKPFVIELYDSPDWETLLFGSWKIDGDSLVYEEGILDRAIREKHTVFDIRNGPWSDPKFQDIWQEACNLGYIQYEGKTYPLPNISLMKSFGFTSKERSAHLYFAENKPFKDAKVLNPNLFHEFFDQYKVDNDKKTLHTIPGWIEQFAGKAVEVNVTADLTEGQWAMLADKCIAHDVTLVLHPLFKMTKKILRKTHTIIVESDDRDVSVKRIVNKNPETKWQVINIDECTSADLLENIDPGWDEEKKKFKFTKTECALLDGLKNNKNMILTGNFSPELIDTLSPLLLERLSREKANGKLVLVSEKNPFSFIKPMTHKVTSKEKAALLDAKKVKNNRPFSHLKAEIDFKKMGLDRSPWDGMRTLSIPSFTDKKIQYDESKKIAKAFTDNRIHQVNAILSKAPFVFLTGLTGVGKSTFVQKDFFDVLKEEKNPGRLYQSETALTDWALDQKPGKKILFIDEANLSKRQWSEFEGLFNTPPGILINGVYHERPNPKG